jgi:hypothetical protein
MNWKRSLLSLALMTVVAAAVLTLITGPAFEAQAKPSCEVECKKDYQQCRSFCGRPEINCFVACETVYDWCLADCGAIIE